MNADLAAQLRRLGLGKGPGGFKPPEKRRGARKIEELVTGSLSSDGDSSCFVVESNYPLDHLHGHLKLGDLLDVSSQVAADLNQEPGLAQLSFREYLFLDTETTGLSGGTGTLAFLVGIGFFDQECFTLRQYFLRSPGDEPAMLAALTEQLALRPGLISFNGRSFDVPLLESRFILNRRPPRFSPGHHLDLLGPSRRLWRDSLDSCRLLSLEHQVLGVRRDQSDVPGGEIPRIYRDYLRTGNAIEMPRILYHNQVDVLSLVTLTTRLCRVFECPADQLQRGREWFSLARWYERTGRVEAAETAYRQALEADLAPSLFPQVLCRLALLLKRAERRDEAVVVWQQLAVVEMDDVRGHVELAKHHEWISGELDLALEWVQGALALVERWPPGLARLVRHELAHRRARLERKIGGRDSEKT